MPSLARLFAALVAALVAAATVLTSAVAGAENPAWPSADRDAPPEAMMDPATWPDDPGYAGRWNYWSYVPQQLAGADLGPEDRVLGTGMHVDRAWLLTTGDFRVTIAVLESGFRWDNRDLVNQWRLNEGELPVPRLADGTDAPSHDANGDGRFNVQDYTSATGHAQPDVATVTDPRLTGQAGGADWNGNGFLDPQDLLHAFSDGTDSDANGYVDDICGWDFLWDDNDAVEETGNNGQGYSHGDGEARQAAAEGNNGISDIGVCPACSVLPVRPDDSFIADVNAIAAGIVFAVDHGAKVVHMAGGGMDHTPLIQAAIDHAYANGAVAVGSAGDETSYHPEFPGAAERALYVHAVMYDGASWESSRTFLNMANCTNFGGRLELSAADDSCSSGAMARTDGHLGLIHSMAVQKGLELSAAEVLQLAWMAADDIDVAGSEDDPTKFPSGPGWDPHFGHGRSNVRRSVELVDRGAIPPEVDVTSPLWFETVAPGELAITGRVAASRAPSFDWVVELAAGLRPAEGDYVVVGGREGATAPVDGTLATADVSRLFDDPTLPPMDDPHQFAATIRVRATARYGGAIGEAPAMFRKTFFVHRDPSLHEGFPIAMGASGESSPRLFDLDGDGKDEIVVATADGRVHVLDAAGEEWPGFPVVLGDQSRIARHASSAGWRRLGTDWQEALFATASVGDVDGDGAPEIVVGTYAGRVHVIGTDGTIERTWELDRSLLDCDWGPDPSNDGACRYTGFQKVAEGETEDLWEARILHPGFFASPVLADYTGDGALDVVQAGMDGVLYVWDGRSGDPVPGFPVRVYDPRGARSTRRDGKPTRLSMRAELLSTPAVADLDGDGKPEILVGTNEVYGDSSSRGRMYLIQGTGATGVEDPESSWWPGFPLEVTGLTLDVLPFAGRGVTISPVIADMDGDGTPELGAHGIAAQSEFYRFTFDHSDDRIDRRTEQAFLGAGDNGTPGELASSDDLPSWIPVNSGSVGDLDNDGLLEYVTGTLGSDIIFGMSGAIRNEFDHQLAAWSIGATLADAPPGEKWTAPMVRGFPQKVDDYMFFMNYAIGDVDGDGLAEVVHGTGVYRVNAFNFRGEQPAGWPKHTGGWIMGTPALGDLDGDGFLDVVANTRNGWLFAWRTTGSAASIQWEGFHHDARATGNFATPLPDRRAAEPPPDDGPGTGEPAAGGGDSGCGCTTAPVPAFGWVLLVLLPLLRRRRRTLARSP